MRADDTSRVYLTPPISSKGVWFEGLCLVYCRNCAGFTSMCLLKCGFISMVIVIVLSDALLASLIVQLEPGQVLPPAEKLKGKILIKDKLMRKKGESTSNFSSLQRGASVNMDSITEEAKKQVSDGTESPLSTVTG